MLWVLAMEVLVILLAIVVMLVVVPIALIAGGIQKIQQRKTAPEAETAVRTLIGKHVRALALKKRQLVYADAYGVLNMRRWNNEKEHFYDHVVRTSIAPHPCWNWPQVSTWIEEAIAAFEASPEYTSSPLSKSIEGMSPSDYERHCAALLTSLGWVVRVTKGSGDQGADVIAEKDGVRIVLQCKKHSKPVGNKAVQEALAAMKFEDAEIAAVVSNARFTPAAQALAHRSGVALLHHSELDRVEEIARGTGSVRREAFRGGMRACPRQLRTRIITCRSLAASSLVWEVG